VSTGVAIGGLAAHLVPAREIEAREQRQRLSTGIAALDERLGGGWPRGAVAELCGPRGHGRTAILLASLAAALRQGEAAALVDFDGAFDPRTAHHAGVPLERLLWVRAPGGEGRSGIVKRTLRLLSAAEAVVAAGGFGLLVLDLGESTPFIPGSAWLRLRRVTGAPGTVVLAVALRPVPGLLGSASVTLHEGRARFTADAPALLLGLESRTTITRNLGGGKTRPDPSGPASTLDFRHVLHPRP
jgi:recA bacterial DNA recombination protein